MRLDCAHKIKHISKLTRFVRLGLYAVGDFEEEAAYLWMI